MLGLKIWEKRSARLSAIFFGNEAKRSAPWRIISTTPIKDHKNDNIQQVYDLSNEPPGSTLSQSQVRAINTSKSKKP